MTPCVLFDHMSKTPKYGVYNDMRYGETEKPRILSHEGLESENLIFHDFCLRNGRNNEEIMKIVAKEFIVFLSTD